MYDRLFTNAYDFINDLTKRLMENDWYSVIAQFISGS